MHLGLKVIDSPALDSQDELDFQDEEWHKDKWIYKGPHFLELLIINSLCIPPNFSINF
jgi:hypothetical protein